MVTSNTSSLWTLEKKMHNAESYVEWKEYALAHDKRSGKEAWKQEEKSKLYDYKEIRSRLDILREHRANKDDEALLFTLYEGIHGNMGGMGNANLYSKAKFGTKQLIVDYINEVSDALLHLVNTDIDHERKVAFFDRASHCFGRSALMLSGGGQLGNFHTGVLKAMVENGLLPNVISGSSAGGIFAAILGTHTDEELIEILQPERFTEILELEADVYSDLIHKNQRLGLEKIQKIFDAIIPNITFQEAFEKTGRKINISISPSEKYQNSRLLNAITSPNVMLHSAVFATSAVPGIYPPVTLKAKNIQGEIVDYLPSRKWVDGSMSSDLPAKRLSRLYDVNHFIVSLTNPLVLPFVNSTFNQLDFLAPLKNLNIALLKETTQFNYSISRRLFKYMPHRLALTANAINSVVQQEYSGDINIVAEFNMVQPHKLLSALPPDELAVLIKKGERKAWEQLEAIRLTTKIGRVLDQILDTL